MVAARRSPEMKKGTTRAVPAPAWITVRSIVACSSAYFLGAFRAWMPRPVLGQSVKEEMGDALPTDAVVGLAVTGEPDAMQISGQRCITCIVSRKTLNQEWLGVKRQRFGHGIMQDSSGEERQNSLAENRCFFRMHSA